MDEAKNRAPVGEKRKLPKNERATPLVYERGGRLRQDLRLKMVSDKADEVTALVGVSKATNKVGWRAHFVLFGTKKLYANNFLDAAFVRTKTTVEVRFSAMVGKRAKELFK